MSGLTELKRDARAFANRARIIGRDKTAEMIERLLAALTEVEKAND